MSVIELPVHTGTTTLSPGLTWAIMGSVTDRAYDAMGYIRECRRDLIMIMIMILVTIIMMI